MTLRALWKRIPTFVLGIGIGIGIVLVFVLVFVLGS